MPTDLQTHGLAPEIFTAGILCVLPTHCMCESASQNTLGQIGRLLSILSYIESLYIHLLIYVWFAIVVP